jgi:hypothetical protein
MLAYDWTFGSVLWGMVVFFFWFMAIWVFIAVFADIFHRNDLSGWGKAGWIASIVVLPFLGALIYVVARPKMTAQDRDELRGMQEAHRRSFDYSPADEIAKLTRLHQAGEITDEQYEALKSRAMASV